MANLVIEERSLFNYLYCPLLFHAEQCQSYPLNKKVNDYILDTIVYYYSGILEGRLKTYKELEKKFQSTFKTLTKDDFLKAWEKVVKITEWSKQEKLIIGDINTPYTYLSNKGYSVNGKIPFTTVTTDKKIILLYFDLGDKKFDTNYLDKKLKYSLDYFAFKQLYGLSPTFIKVHHVKYNEDYVFFKSANEVNGLNTIINNVCKSIEEQIIYPRETYLCKGCQYNKFCAYWCQGKGMPNNG